LSFLVDDANAKNKQWKWVSFQIWVKYIYYITLHTYTYTYDDDWFVSAALPLLQQLLLL
jgi:hypothetical protein